MYNYLPNLYHGMGEAKTDFSLLLDKPYFVNNITWSSTDLAFAQLTTFPVPLNILNNPLVRKPFESTALYRTQMCLLAQVAGTPMHSGTLLIGACPRGTSAALLSASPIDRLQTVMASPHVFLSANECSSVCLEIPFYSPTELIRTDYPGSLLNTSQLLDINFADIMIVVLNPLGVPTSGSSSVTLSLHVQFESSEFYVPHVDPTFVPQSKAVDAIFAYGKTIAEDFIDQGRSLVRRYTGLHNPNESIPDASMVSKHLSNPNAVEGKTFFDNMTPFPLHHRIVDRPIFNTMVDEMSVKHILSKPVFLGTFNVSSTTTTGKNVWARPITPWQTSFAAPNIKLHNTTEILLGLAAYWRGKIKIHIQSSMTNFHYLKLLVARNYSPVLQQLTSVPSFADVPNLITDTLEFSAGGQVQTIELPFFAPTPMLPISFDPITNALQHGMYYIYLLQPLVVNGAVPLNAQFNVFMTCEDVELFGFGNQPTNGVITSSVLSFSLPTEEKESTFEPESAVVPEVSDQKPILNNTSDEGDGEAFDNILRPILSIRDIARRLVPVANIRLTGSTNHVTAIRVAEALGFNTSPSPAQAPMNGTTNLSVVAGLFSGYSGGAKFRIVVQGIADVNLHYLPPTMRFGTSANSIVNARSQSAIFTSATAIDASANTMISDKYRAGQIDSTNRTLTQLPFKIVSDIVPQMQANRRTVYEVEIPNLNPLKYIGDLVFRNSPNQEYLANSLGTLVISVNTIATGDIVGVRIFAGITDEARYGFQCISFPRIIPTVDVAYPTTTPTPYQIGNGGLMSTTPALTGLPPIFNASSSACYYAL